MATNSVKERLEAYLEYRRISKSEFGRSIGVSTSYVSAIRKSIDKEKIKKIEAIYPDLNIDWLLYGQGKMIKGAYDRINQILSIEGLSQKDFAKGAGGIAFLFPSIYSNAQNNPGDPDVLSQWVDAVLVRFPQYSRDWILFGQGPMRLATPQDFSLKTDRIVDQQEVPLYDYNATAGLVAIFNDHALEPTDFLKIPNLPPVDGAIYIRGESMSPLLKSGDIVMYKKKELSIDSILWGEIYLLSFVSDGDTYTAVKYIQKADEADKVRLASFNPTFAPKDIPMSSITALALVKASLTFHTME